MFRHGGVVGLTKELGTSPGMARLLVRIVCHLVPEHPFTTLTLLSQACLKPHKDNFNLPCSNVVIPLQLPNEGGGIWVQDPNGCDVRQVTEKMVVPGRVHPLKIHEPFFLDPHKWHASEAWDSGSRILVVAYAVKGVDKLEHTAVRELQGVGFPVESFLASTCALDSDGDCSAVTSNCALGSDGDCSAVTSNCALDGDCSAVTSNCALDGRSAVTSNCALDTPPDAVGQALGSVGDEGVGGSVPLFGVPRDSCEVEKGCSGSLKPWGSSKKGRVGVPVKHVSWAPMLVQECGAAVDHGKGELHDRLFDVGVHVQSVGCTACERDTVGVCSVRERDVINHCAEEFSASPLRHGRDPALGTLDAQSGKVRGRFVLGASCDRTIAGPSLGFERGCTSPNARGAQHEPECFAMRVAETTFAELGALVFREPGIEEVSLGVGPVQEPSGLLFLHDKGDSGELVVQHECSGLSHDLLADVCEREQIGYSML